MIQAISQSRSSESATFGSYLAELVGFNPVITKKPVRRSKVDALLDKYQKQLIDKANKSYDWQEFAEYLVVDIGDSNRIEVFIDGPDYIIDRANLLEFGTPEKPADPLMRVAEAEFNEDFHTKRMFSR